MMRVVEIGLPFLLSLLSIFFVLKYSLTEETIASKLKIFSIKEMQNVANGENNATRADNRIRNKVAGFHVPCAGTRNPEPEPGTRNKKL